MAAIFTLSSIADFDDLGPKIIWKLVFDFDKVAHAILYAGLAVMVLRATSAPEGERPRSSATPEAAREGAASPTRNTPEGERPRSSATPEAAREGAASPTRNAALSLLITFLYGVSDEVHQYFVPGRSMSIADGIADLVGAGISCGVWYWRKK